MVKEGGLFLCPGFERVSTGVAGTSTRIVSRITSLNIHCNAGVNALVLAFDEIEEPRFVCLHLSGPTFSRQRVM